MSSTRSFFPLTISRNTSKIKNRFGVPSCNEFVRCMNTRKKARLVTVSERGLQWGYRTFNEETYVEQRIRVLIFYRRSVESARRFNCSSMLHRNYKRSGERNAIIIFFSHVRIFVCSDKNKIDSNVLDASNKLFITRLFLTIAKGDAELPVSWVANSEIIITFYRGLEIVRD